MDYSDFDEKTMSLYGGLFLSFVLPDLDWLSLASTQECNSGWVDDFVENRSAIDKQSEAKYLQPLEALPSKAQTDDPDEESPAGVNSASCRSGDESRDAQAEEVETTVHMLAYERCDGCLSTWTYPIEIMIRSEVIPMVG